MIRFGAPSTAGRELMRHCKERIDAREFDALREEPGFSPPNTFSVEELMQPLARERFPEENHYEYLWAIYECGLGLLERCSAAMRVYLASLYVYCNKRRIWGTTVECDYYHALIHITRESRTDFRPAELLAFIEWLNDHVPAAEGYDDYFCLLSWAFLRRLAGRTDDERFREVIAHLGAKRYSKERLAELAVSDRWPAAWLELNRLLPAAGAGIEKELEHLISGT
jgi:hypothetical protein